MTSSSSRHLPARACEGFRVALAPSGHYRRHREMRTPRIRTPAALATRAAERSTITRGLSVCAALAACCWLPATAGAAPRDVIRVGGPSAPSDPKVAVVASGDSRAGRSFSVVNGKGRKVLSGRLRGAPGSPAPWRRAATADLSKVTAPGSYTVRVGKLSSPKWVVAADARSRQVR